MWGCLTCNCLVVFLDKPYVSTFLAYVLFIPEIHNMFLATVITTWTGKSNQVHALNPTLATTGVMTEQFSFYQCRKSTSHHLLGRVWKISDHQLSQKHNSQQQLQSNLLSFGFSALKRACTRLNKVLHFFFMVAGKVPQQRDIMEQRRQVFYWKCKWDEFDNVSKDQNTALRSKPYCRSNVLLLVKSKEFSNKKWKAEMRLYR